MAGDGGRRFLEDSSSHAAHQRFLRVQGRAGPGGWDYSLPASMFRAYGDTASGPLSICQRKNPRQDEGKRFPHTQWVDLRDDIPASQTSLRLFGAITR